LWIAFSPEAAPSQQEGLEEITASDLKQRLDRGDDIQIIDVREPNEYEIARMSDSRLIPLARLWPA